MGLANEAQAVIWLNGMRAQMTYDRQILHQVSCVQLNQHG